MTLFWLQCRIKKKEKLAQKAKAQGLFLPKLNLPLPKSSQITQNIWRKKKKGQKRERRKHIDSKLIELAFSMPYVGFHDLMLYSL